MLCIKFDEANMYVDAQNCINTHIAVIFKILQKELFIFILPITITHSLLMFYTQKCLSVVTGVICMS